MSNKRLKERAGIFESLLDSDRMAALRDDSAGSYGIVLAVRYRQRALEVFRRRFTEREQPSLDMPRPARWALWLVPETVILITALLLAPIRVSFPVVVVGPPGIGSERQGWILASEGVYDLVRAAGGGVVRDGSVSYDLRVDQHASLVPAKSAASRLGLTGAWPDILPSHDIGLFPAAVSSLPGGEVRRANGSARISMVKAIFPQ